MLRDMVERGLAPAGLLFNRVNPILAQGAVFADLPLMDRFIGDVTHLIATGDEILLDPAGGKVTILRRSEARERWVLGLAALLLNAGGTHPISSSVRPA